MEKIDILAIGVHPDDVELSASGTILKHMQLGYTVGLLDLTMGELGSRGSAAIREVEAKNSATLMGVKFRTCVHMEDGFFSHTQENLIKIIRIIRECKPDLILANALSDRHPDHGRAAKLVHDACFLSGLIKIETKNDEGKNQPPWRPKNLLHYIQDQNLTPDIVFDITEFMDKKLELILAFRSQFYDPNSTEVETPISGKGFLEFVKGKNQALGRSINVAYAEGFNISRIVGVNDLFDLK
jgi:N-acetylglucosamine malate deacetylase 1